MTSETRLFASFNFCSFDPAIPDLTLKSINTESIIIGVIPSHISVILHSNINDSHKPIIIWNIPSIIAVILSDETLLTV